MQYARTTPLKPMTVRAQTTTTLDGEEYPARWSQFVGQEPAVRMLQVAAASARLRREPLDHVLIAHPTPGLGKTALANLVAKELRRPIRVVSGMIQVSRARLILSEMQDRHVLLYDEFHRVAEGGKGQSEWLLHLLQDGVLMGPRGPEQQPRITLIAATTHPQKLPAAVVDRFMLVPPMQEYNTEEVARIARLMANRMLKSMPRLTKAEGMLLATAAGCNPRGVKKLLVSLRDLTVTDTLPLIRGRYDVAGLLRWQGITPDGLGPEALRYLQTLAVEFEGQAGVKALEDHLQQAGGLAAVERMLIDRGLLAKTRTGRQLTQAGLSRYRDLAG